MLKSALRAIICVLAVPALAATVYQVTPGKWASTGNVVMVDMPSIPPEALAMMKRRPINHNYCVTKADAEGGAKGLFFAGNGDCEYKKFDMSGGRINAVMECKGPQGNMRMTMVGHYDAANYETTNVMVMGGPQGPMRMTSKIRGKHTGAC